MISNLYFRTLLFLLVIASFPAGAQTISLNVNAAGKAGIKLDNKAVGGSTTAINLKAGATLQFKLNNTSGKTLIISLQNKDDLLPAGTSLPPIQIDLLAALQAAGGKMATDASLNLTVNGQAVSINRPFDITLAVKGNPQSAVDAVFQPKLAASVTPLPAPENNNNTAAKNTGDNTQAAKVAVYHPGSAVYDAIKLSDPKILQPDFLAIMAAYYPNVKVAADVVDDIKENPFLEPKFTQDYINSLKQLSGNQIQSAGAISSLLSASGVGGLDVTSIADGLAKFLVKRTEQELGSAFFQKLSDKIKASKDLQVILPQTSALLGSMGTEIYNYGQYLQNLRSAFQSDLQALDVNLPGLIPIHQSYFDTQHTLGAAITGSCYFVHGLRTGVHPGDLIEGYPVTSLSKEPQAWTAAFETIQLLSESLRDTSGTDAGYWVDIKYIRQLLANKETFRVYLGLLYQEALRDYDGLSYDQNTSFLTLLDDLADHYDNDVNYYQAYKQYILSYEQKVNALNQLIRNNPRPANDSLAVEQYASYFNATLDILHYTLNAANLPGADKAPEIGKFATAAGPYLSIADNISALALDINRKEYPGAVNEILSVYDVVYTQPLAAEKAAAGTQVSAALQTNITNYAVYRTDVARYGTFIATVATAKTSDDVESAIESFVLPPGSSSVKRETPFNVALQAYTGLFYGHEQIQGVASGSNWFNTYGVTAPIGVSVSIGQRKFFCPFSGGGHASASLFISLVDVGAVAAYRFGDSQTASAPTIHLKDIFSPGAFLSLGIPKTPLSINFGAQTGPSLREITNGPDGTPVANWDSRIYWRFSAALVVDLPLINLYARSN